MLHMNNNYNWQRYLVNMPPEGIRILISDGVDIVISRYVKSDSHINWIYDSETHKDINIDWWCELPALPKKIITTETI